MKILLGMLILASGVFIPTNFYPAMDITVKPRSQTTTIKPILITLPYRLKTRTARTTYRRKLKKRQTSEAEVFTSALATNRTTVKPTEKPRRRRRNRYGFGLTGPMFLAIVGAIIGFLCCDCLTDACLRVYQLRRQRTNNETERCCCC